MRTVSSLGESARAAAVIAVGWEARAGAGATTGGRAVAAGLSPYRGEPRWRRWGILRSKTAQVSASDAKAAPVSTSRTVRCPAGTLELGISSLSRRRAPRRSPGPARAPNARLTGLQAAISWLRLLRKTGSRSPSAGDRKGHCEGAGQCNATNCAGCCAGAFCVQGAQDVACGSHGVLHVRTARTVVLCVAFAAGDGGGATNVCGYHGASPFGVGCASYCSSPSDCSPGPGACTGTSPSRRRHGRPIDRTGLWSDRLLIPWHVHPGEAPLRGVC